MKKLLVVSVLAATSTVASAFDYKINLEGRADFVNSNTKSTDAGVTTTQKFNNFSNGLVRVNMMGVVNENLSYRFRYRFIKTAANPLSATTLNARENSDVGVDYLFVDHKNSIFTARLGKQNWVEAAGRESFVSGTDVFLTSLAFTNYKAGFGSDYRYGATAMFKLDTNTLNVAVSNPNSTFTDKLGTKQTNTGVALGAFYTGSFLEKMVQPVLAYSIAKQNGDIAAANTKDSNNTLWSAGLKSEIAGFVIDADYKMFKKGNAGATIVEEKTKSIYSSVAYAFGEFTPMAYYINDKFESQTAAAAKKINSFAVGTYWKPMADVNFRYHLMFTSAQTKADGAASTVAKVDDKKFYLGFKADI